VRAIGLHHHRHGHARLAAVACQRDLREHERRGCERGPLGSAATVVGEGKAAHEDGSRRGRALRVARGIVEEGAPAEVARAHGDLAEASRPTRLQGDRTAQAGENEAVAVGLLEAEEAVVGTARAQHGGAEVEVGRKRDGDRRQRGSPLPPRPLERPLHPLGERLLRLLAQRERARDARCRERHGFKG
jgi:hypothetical protein